MSLISAENRFGAFRHSSYRRFFTARFFAAFAFQIVSVSVGWQMYEVTGNAFYLGLIGLFQFLPSLLLILVTGTVADRHNRRLIMAIGFIVAAVCAAALLGLTLTHTFAPWPVFAILVVIGIERAFMGPAVQSLGPNLVPVEDLPNAVAWNSSSWQMASILGPVVGGLLYGVGASLAYGVAFSLFALAAIGSMGTGASARCSRYRRDCRCRHSRFQTDPSPRGFADVCRRRIFRGFDGGLRSF